ncbi:MAG TPA: hypothetical protein VK002_10095 [Rubricoccaceae bacterium]|nr:hypothetical protein [Rubricoccaceae bacterium]
MTHASSDQHPGRLAGFGLLLSLPALGLVTSGLLQSATGREVFFPPELLVHPAVVLGGLLAALVLNALPTLRLTREPGADAVVLRLEVRRRAANLAVLALAAGLLAVLLLYAFAENFAPR